MCLNAAQAIIDHTKSANSPNKEQSILVYINAAFSTVIESIVWLSVAELPLHEYRVYTCMCAWIANWLLTSLAVWLAFELGKRAFLLTSSSFLIIVITAILFMKMPNTNNRTTSQITRKFLDRT